MYVIYDSFIVSFAGSSSKQRKQTLIGVWHTELSFNF